MSFFKICVMPLISKKNHFGHVYFGHEWIFFPRDAKKNAFWFYRWIFRQTTKKWARQQNHQLKLSDVFAPLSCDLLCTKWSLGMLPEIHAFDAGGAVIFARLYRARGSPKSRHEPFSWRKIDVKKHFGGPDFPLKKLFFELRFSAKYFLKKAIFMTKKRN